MDIDWSTVTVLISGSIAARPHMDGSLFPLWQRFFPCSRHDFCCTTLRSHGLFAEPGALCGDSQEMWYATEVFHGWTGLDWRFTLDVQLVCFTWRPQECEHWQRTFHHGHHFNDRKHSRSVGRCSALRPDLELLRPFAEVYMPAWDAWIMYDSVGHPFFFPIVWSFWLNGRERSGGWSIPSSMAIFK